MAFFWLLLVQSCLIVLPLRAGNFPPSCKIRRRRATRAPVVIRIIDSESISVGRFWSSPSEETDSSSVDLFPKFDPRAEHEELFPEDADIEFSDIEYENFEAYREHLRERKFWQAYSMVSYPLLPFDNLREVKNCIQGLRLYKDPSLQELIGVEGIGLYLKPEFARLLIEKSFNTLLGWVKPFSRMDRFFSINDAIKKNEMPLDEESVSILLEGYGKERYVLDRIERYIFSSDFFEHDPNRLFVGYVDYKKTLCLIRKYFRPEAEKMIKMIRRMSYDFLHIPLSSIERNGQLVLAIPQPEIEESEGWDLVLEIPSFPIQVESEESGSEDSFGGFEEN